MNTSQQIAKHFKEVYFGGNWTTSCLKGLLQDLSYKEALTSISNLNTIALLTYHIHYYVREVSSSLEGNEFIANDKFSFDMPILNSEKEWQYFLKEVWTTAEKFIALLENFEDKKLFDFFIKEKYGTHYRNFHGIIEHSHYHLGQIAVIKKLLSEK